MKAPSRFHGNARERNLINRAVHAYYTRCGGDAPLFCSERTRVHRHGRERYVVVRSAFETLALYVVVRTTRGLRLQWQDSGPAWPEDLRDMRAARVEMQRQVEAEQERAESSARWFKLGLRLRDEHPSVFGRLLEEAKAVIENPTNDAVVEFMTRMDREVAGIRGAA